MSSIFDLIADTVDYTAKIDAFDIDDIADEYHDIINNYRTPNREYLSASKRGLSADVVESDTLEYIITRCNTCTNEQKYEASVVVLHKLVQKGVDEIPRVKAGLIRMLKEPEHLKHDLSYIDKAIEECPSLSFFYLIEITIGVNKLLKYGITDRNPRPRFAEIKADIKSNHSKFGVEINPVLLLHTEQNKELEEAFKLSLSENSIYSTKYKFKGSSETYALDKLELTEQLLYDISESYDATVCYYRDDEVEELAS